VNNRISYFSNVAAAAPDRLIAPAHRPTSSPPTSRTLASDHGPARATSALVEGDHRHFQKLLAIVGFIAVSLSILIVWVWLHQHRFADGAAAVAVAALGVGTLIVRSRVTPVNLSRAVVATSAAILILAVTVSVAGNGTSTPAMTSLLAVLIAVPYVDRQTLKRLAVATWFVAAFVGLVYGLAVPLGARPSEGLIRCVGVTLNSTIALFVIFHLSDRLIGAVQRYRDLVQRVPVGMYRTTPEGRFLDVNPAFATMFGFDGPEAMVDVGADTLYAEPADRQRFQDAVETAGVARWVEFRARRADGRLFWVRDSSQLVRDASGKPIYYEGIVEDVTERKGHELRLEHRASVDGLTGLANRSVMTELLDEALVEASPGRNVALLFVDLDDFKQVNDKFGHARGDDLLIEAGRRLRVATRDTDVVARFGGDEFAVLLEVPTGPVPATAVARRIVDAFRAPFLIGAAGESVTRGASVGVAIADETVSTSELVHRADSAMYAAKLGDKVALFAS
jgi:diguanylate cyclase (GGDEF)-like protein/PAS domain S-box-containing protein